MGTAMLFNMILTKHTIQLQDILTEQSLLISLLQPMSQLQYTSQLLPIINLRTRHHLMTNQPNTTSNGKSLMTMQSLTTDKTKVEMDMPQVANTASSSPIAVLKS